MKNKAILVSFIALFAIVFALNTVIAASEDVDYVEITDVIVNDISVDGDTIAAGMVHETVPVEVKFKATGAWYDDEHTEVSDVRVKVYIEGYRVDISDSTSRFRIVEGSTYIKRFNLDLPSSMDLDEDPEDLQLVVRISAKGEDSLENEYDLTMQKEQYSLNIMSVEFDESVDAGNVIPVDIVLQNNGGERLDNVYVRVSIPEAGISRKTFFGDMSPDAEDDYDDIVDSASKRVYLNIPKDTITGIYNLQVEAYNYDSSAEAMEKIVIDGVDKVDGEEPDDDDDDDEPTVIDGDDDETSRDSVLVLTIVLAIIFVVLLVILIVLLTKKPAETEEFNETSYY